MSLTPSATPHLQTGSGTHPGETGKNNEDSLGLSAYHDPRANLPVTLAVVADGIGGSRAGEVASALVVKLVTEAVVQGNGPDYRGLLELGLVSAAIGLAEQSRQPETFGMGSTCVAALVAGRQLYTAYIGDSRLYLARGDAIRQTTIDHTWVQEAVQAGVITRDEARTHPNRHMVRRHLGRDAGVRPDFRLRLFEHESASDSEKNQGLKLEPDDTLLLCSDGLSDLAEPDEILGVLRRQEPQAAVDELIRLARQRGGHDNITMIVMRVG